MRVTLRWIPPALVLVVLWIFSPGARAFTYYSYPYGEKVGIVDARSLSMGGTGVAYGENAFALQANPACLADIKIFGVSSTIQLTKVDEDRAFPFHDSFDGFVDYNTYAMNSNVYGNYAFGIVKAFPKTRFPNVAVAGYPLYDWNYEYFEEVRDGADLLIGKNVIENRKGISAISMGLGRQVTSWLDVGLSVNYLRADGEFERRAFGDTVIVSDRQDLDADGFSVNLGAVAQLTHRARLGLAYRSPSEIDGTIALSGKEIAAPDSSRALKLTYPYSLALGLEYRPRNELTTCLNFEAEFTRWSKFEDQVDPSLDFDDVWQLAAGVEHQFFIGAPIRFGFRYQPSHQDKKVTTTAVSFGTGFSYQGFQIDLGGEIGTRSWRQKDLFPESYYGGVERTDQDRVKESLLRAMVSVGYRI